MNHMPNPGSENSQSNEESTRETSRLLLRPIGLQELSSNYPNWLNDPVVCQFNRHRNVVHTQESIRDFIEGTIGDNSRAVWACYLKDGQVHIGNLSLQSIDRVNKNAEIAFLFGEPEYWGQGFAQEAAEALLDYGFNTLDLHRIHCGTASGNMGMRRLAKKLNFAEEGIRKESLWIDGEWMDIYEFGLLREDFENVAR